MEGVLSWNDLETHLLNRSAALYEKNSSSTRLIGIALAPDDISQVQAVLSALKRWHIRSGNHFDIYWPGYRFNGFNPYSPKPMVDMTPTEFDIKRFYVFVDELNSRLNEGAIGKSVPRIPSNTLFDNNQYSGEFDLILMDAKFDPSSKLSTLLLGTSVIFHMNHLTDINSTLNPNILLERLVQFSSYRPEDGLTSAFADDIELSKLNLQRGPTATTVLSTLSNVLGSVSAVVSLF